MRLLALIRDEPAWALSRVKAAKSAEAEVDEVARIANRYHEGWCASEEREARLREALLVATTTVEEWEAQHRATHPDPDGFRRAAVAYGKGVLAGTAHASAHDESETG